MIAAIGGGGLITGVGSAVKALKPEIKIWGAEPETAAPAALSFARARRRRSPTGRPRSSTAPAAQSVFPRMWERMRPVVDGCDRGQLWRRPGARCG